MKQSADEYAASFVASLDLYDALRPRTQQREMGVSSVGLCASYAGFKLAGAEPTDAPVSRQAAMGSAAHDLIAAARKAFKPELLTGVEVEVTLPSGIVLVGHPDEVDPSEPSVTDAKTVADEAALIALRRTGSSLQQRFQRHLYYLGCAQAGLVPPAGTVRNVWTDRSGQAEWVHVEQEPFDMAIIHDADRWLGDVAYAVEHGEETPRDKHYTWCQRFCEFFSACRAGQTHSDLIISDPEFIGAASLVMEGRETEKIGKGLTEHGRRVLADLQAYASDNEDMVAFVAGDYRVRWNRVHRTDASFWRLDVDRVGTG